jgi:hypothetical protein
MESLKRLEHFEVVESHQGSSRTAEEGYEVVAEAKRHTASNPGRH